MGTTPIYGFPYPDPSDLVANYPALGQQLAEDVETEIAAASQIVQIVYASTTTQVSTTSSSYVDSGLSATITPTSASNKVLALVSQNILINRSASTTAMARVQLVRTSTVIVNGTAEQFGVYEGNSADRGMRAYVVQNILDTPATTSATTYKTQMRVEASGDLFAQYSGAFSSMILMEVKA